MDLFDSNNSSPEPQVITRRKTLKDGRVREYTYPADKYRKPKAAAPAAAESPSSEYVANKSGLWRRLVEEFKKTPEVKALAAISDDHLQDYLDTLEDRIGQLTKEELENPEVAVPVFLALRNSYADRPVMGNRLIGTLKRVLSYGKLSMLVRQNHSMELPYLPTNKRSRRSMVWPEDRLERARQWPAHVADGVQFLLLTGMRVGDAVRMGPDRFDGKWLIFCPRKTAKKTGIIVRLPVWELEPLAELMDRLKGRERLLLQSRGKPWADSDSLGAAIRKHALADFGKEERRTVHDLRRTMITRLGSAGATEAERAAISGHLLPASAGELGTYTDATPDMAMAAFRKLNNWMAEGRHQNSNIIGFAAARKPAGNRR